MTPHCEAIAISLSLMYECVEGALVLIAYKWV